MQLPVILALLMLSGKGSFDGADELLNALGVKDIGNIIKEAEEICGSVAAIRAADTFKKQEENTAEEQADDFPLAPVDPIADSEITYRLAKYISEDR